MSETTGVRARSRIVALCAAVVTVGAALCGCGTAPHANPDGAVSDATVSAGSAEVPPGALFVSPKGSNSSAGTEQAPLRTLHKAVRTARDGQAIVLRGGVYRETAGIVRKRLLIQSYPGERVWFKGSDVLTDWASDGDTWVREDWNPPLCRSCYLPGIVDQKHPQAGKPDMVFANGAPLRQVGSRDAVGRGEFFVDTAEHELVIGTDPDTATIEATTRPYLMQFDDAAAGSELRGIGVAQYGSNQDYGNHGAMVVANAPGIRLQDNTFAWSASTGALVTKPDAVLSGNSFVHNGLAGLVANEADRIRLVRNEFRANNAEHFALSGDSVGAAGAKITHTARAYVTHNRFVDNAANGWWCDLGCTDAAVVDNLAEGNQGNGLYYEVSSRALIVSNALIDNQRGLKVSSSDGVRIYHNSFAGNPVAVGLFNDPRPVLMDSYSSMRGLSWRTEGTELVNNMLTVPSADGPVLESGDIAGKPVGRFISRADGNAYVCVGAGPSRPLASWLLNNAVVPLVSLGELRARTGAEPNGLVAVLMEVPFTARQGFALNRHAPGVHAGLPTPADIAAAAGVHASPHPNIGILTTPG